MHPYDIARDWEISYGLFNALCGDFLGEGGSRIVYDCRLKPGYVVKIEKGRDTMHNLREFMLWEAVFHQPEINKWFPRCSEITTGGEVLIQQKVMPITDKNKHLIPDKIPGFLTDMKHSNYGFIGKQFVCMDYAFSADIAMSGISASAPKWRKFKSHLNEK